MINDESTWVTTPHLICIVTPLIDLIYCRCGCRAFGDIIEARECVPAEWRWELAEIAAVRAVQMEESEDDHDRD